MCKEIGKNNKQHEAILYFNKQKELDEIVKKIYIQRIRSEKIKGDEVIEYYKKIHDINIEGREIGNKINMIKKYCIVQSNSQSWEDFLDVMTKDKVQDLIKKIITEDKK